MSANEVLCEVICKDNDTSSCIGKNVSHHALAALARVLECFSECKIPSVKLEFDFDFLFGSKYPDKYSKDILKELGDIALLVAQRGFVCTIFPPSYIPYSKVLRVEKL